VSLLKLDKHDFNPRKYNMIAVDDEKKRLWKKNYRRRKKNARLLSQQADEQIEKLLIRRFERLVSVKRFVILWSLLFVVLFFGVILQLRALGPYYQVLKPASGGIFSQGLVGNFTNANPIYASGAADTAISHLIFSGLLKYDSDNKLVGDLAKSWTVNDAQTRYTLNLRKDVEWQNGQHFNADDVVFTYQMIQNIEAQSPLYSSWQGIKVSKKDSYTVYFDLANPLSAFPYSLTNGIIPAQSFKGIKPVAMRTAPFNNNPVGTGPFDWKYVEVAGKSDLDREQRISLAANNNYYGGRPKVDGFNLTTFSNEHSLLSAFNNKQINAMGGLESVPDNLKRDNNVHVYNTPLSGEVLAFFNTSHPILNDTYVRRALISSVDRNQVDSVLEYPVKLVNSPLLPDQLGYDPSLVEPEYNQDNANQLLDKAGWASANNNRTKDDKPLKLSLAAQDTQDYTQVAQFLQSQWSKVGVRVDVHYYSSDDLQKAVIPSHDYDILLYGVSLGVDPDVFAYWDSSQASLSSQGHLNLSEYKSKVADQALESGRTRSDPELRATKYKVFLTAWVNDAPALVLYQPNMIYVSRGPVFNYERKEANTSADQFYNVNQWMIRQKHANL
jgi:peptide/nickel transport system substrate-binding protein